MLMGAEPFAGLMWIAALMVKAVPLVILLAGVVSLWLTVGGGWRSRWMRWLLEMPPVQGEAPDPPDAIDGAKEAGRL